MEDAPRPVAWRIPLAVALAGAALAAALHLHARFLNDDALITARYAVRLAGGDGLVYNPGERVLGTTTPLWALLLAGVSALGIDVPSASQWLGIAAHGAASGLVAALFARRGAAPLRQAAAGLLVAACPVLLEWSGSGMEASLCVALLALFLLLFEAERWALLGAAGGALALTRPDMGLVLAAAAALHVAVSRRFRPIARAATGFAAVVLPWFVAATAYYGSPLPNSGFAKRLQVEDWGTYASLLGREIWDLGPALPFAIVGVVAATRAPARALPLAGFLALFLGMHFGGLPGCGWYAPPAVFLLLLVAADGALLVADALQGADGRIPRAAVLARAALAAPLLVAAPLPSLAHDLKVQQGNLERCHGAVGTWLREHAPRDASVGADNIGYIGWRSDLRVVDMLGLVQPETAEAIEKGTRDFALRHHRPELIAVWKNRGNTWKYLPPREWLDEQGYREVFEARLFPHYAPGPAYCVLSRIPLVGVAPPEVPR